MDAGAATHTRATLGLAAGVHVKVISDRLGHATTSFTQDVYIHAIPAVEDAAADQIANLVFDGPMEEALASQADSDDRVESASAMLADDEGDEPRV